LVLRSRRMWQFSTHPRLRPALSSARSRRTKEPLGGPSRAFTRGVQSGLTARTSRQPSQSCIAGGLSSRGTRLISALSPMLASRLPTKTMVSRKVGPRSSVHLKSGIARGRCIPSEITSCATARSRARYKRGEADLADFPGGRIRQPRPKSSSYAEGLQSIPYVPTLVQPFRLYSAKHFLVCSIKNSIYHSVMVVRYSHCAARS
jgi:hypothetical protein